MPDVLLFGATGYTGTLTADALARRGASFVLAGRDPRKLDDLAAATGAQRTVVASVGDPRALAAALDDVAVLLTCVGPFVTLGDTAVQAAVAARTHYVDSTGEIAFVTQLVERHMDAARDAEIVMVPAAGFDEVPSDIALSLAVEGLEAPDAVVTYGLPAKASAGTLRTILTGIGSSNAQWIKQGARIAVRTGERSRWAPMPPPLGPKLGVSVPLAEGALAPLHLELRSLELYAATERLQSIALRYGMPLGRMALGNPLVQNVAGRVLDRLSSGPSERARHIDRWTILAEARGDNGWRNVALSGVDPYGLTAETLAAVALKLARDGHKASGVMSPVQAAGLETLQKELIDFGVDFQTWEGA